MRKPIYKRWWFWLLVIYAISSLSSGISEAARARRQEEAARIIAERTPEPTPSTETWEDQEYTPEEQEAAAQAYYEKIGYDPTQEDAETGIIEDGAVAFVPSSMDTDSGATSDSVAADASTDEAIVTYIVNTNTNVFHYASCKSVGKISPKNQGTFTGTRSEAAAIYKPCGNCKP